MRVLLTGGSGMVGRNLVAAVPRGIELVTPNRGDLNLLSFESALSYVAGEHFDLIIHAAGKVGGIQANAADSYHFLLENASMGMNIVEAARRAGVKRLLNLGSSCMYPKNHDEPLCEDLILKGDLESTNEGYAIAKIMTQRLCQYASQNSELSFKTLIPCNLFGKWDKFDPVQAHLIPAIIRKIVEARHHKEKTIEVWGRGKARREFLYAGDFANMVWRAVEIFERLPSVLNVGTGADHSVQEYYEKTCEALDFSCEFSYDLSKPEGIQRKLMDVSRSRELGIVSSSSLLEGLRETASWFQHELKA